MGNKKFSMSTLHSDIAILVLKKPIQYTSTVKPVCLPKGKQSYEDKLGTVVGWGLLRENGPRPTVLQQLTMKIWNNDKCKRTYGSTAPAGIKDTMLCAGQKGTNWCCILGNRMRQGTLPWSVYQSYPYDGLD